jgi:hypothetical protein
MSYALREVAKLGGVIGGVVGSVIVLIIAEWQWVDWFGDHDALETLLFVALVGGGAFAGSWLLPRISARRH